MDPFYLPPLGEVPEYESDEERWSKVVPDIEHPPPNRNSTVGESSEALAKEPTAPPNSPATTGQKTWTDEQISDATVTSSDGKGEPYIIPTSEIEELQEVVLVIEVEGAEPGIQIIEI